MQHSKRGGEDEARTKRIIVQGKKNYRAQKSNQIK